MVTTSLPRILTHFTRDEIHKVSEEIITSAKDRLISILKDKVVNAFPVGWFIRSDPTNSRAVCLTETSLFHIESHAQAYSYYGIVFTKKYIMESHLGNPVFYMRRDQIKSQNNWNDQLKPFVDDYRRGGFKDWDEVMGEREWRVPKNLGFEYDHVTMVLAPYEEIPDLRDMFPDIKVWFPANWFPHI